MWQCQPTCFTGSSLVSCNLCLHIFALASCLNRALLMHLAHRFLTHPCSSLLRILVLFMTLAPTLMVWAPAPEVPRMRSSMPFFQNLYISKHRSRKFLLSRLGCPVWIRVSRKHLGIFRPGLHRSNRTSAPSLHFSAKSRHMLPQHQIYQVRQDPGLHSNKLTAPQPLGPMAQDHLVTIGTGDADLIYPQTLMMSMREVPSCYGSHANNITKGSLCEESNMPADSRPVTIHCKAGSMSVRLVFETRSKCQDCVARYKDVGMPYEIDSPFCSVKTTIAVRQSRSIVDREIGKQYAPLWRVLADQL